MDERRDDTEESLDEEEEVDDDEEGSIEPEITGTSDEDEEMMLLMPLRDNPPNKWLWEKDEKNEETAEGELGFLLAPLDEILASVRLYR